MAEARFYVYAHRKADTGEVFYIGKGCNRRAWSRKDRSLYWHNTAKKHGLDVQIVQDGLTEQAAFDLEFQLIAMHRAAGLPIVNLTNGGEGVKGLKRAPETAETRAKKRASALGRRMSPDAIAKTAAFHTGRKRSPETIAKMSAALKGKNVGRVKSPEERAKLAAAATGKRHTDETRAILSAKHMGKKCPARTPEHRAAISQAKKKFWEEWRAKRQSANE